MPAKRFKFNWILFLAAVVVSVALTIVFWPNFIALFLVLPFVFPFSGRPRAPSKGGPVACPECGWTSEDPEARYCPRHGIPLPQGDS